MKRVAILALFAVTVALIAYGAITTYDYNMKVGRMWETPAVRPHEEPLLVIPSGPIPTTLAEADYRAVNGRLLKSPLTGDPGAEAIATGKILYGRYCIFCHGKHHDGNGTVGQSFAPLPGDLRSARVQNLPEGMIFKEISYGIPNGRQPALATTISIPDRWYVVAYVKSLGTRE